MAQLAQICRTHQHSDLPPLNWSLCQCPHSLPCAASLSPHRSPPLFFSSPQLSRPTPHRCIAATTHTPRSTATPSSSPPKATCGRWTFMAAPRIGSPPAAALRTWPPSRPTERPWPSAPATKAPQRSTPCPSKAACRSAARGTATRNPPAGRPTAACLYPTQRYSTLPWLRAGPHRRTRRPRDHPPGPGSRGRLLP